MKHHHESLVKRIPIEQIRIVNPRSRGREKFNEIANSIIKLGLKKPIIVARRAGKSEQESFDLVCGQGRLEAFKRAGETTVPAMVIDASKEDLLLMSLAENLARRPFTTLDVAREITAMKERGHTNMQIAKKIGVDHSYVGGIIKLFKQGEERLLSAVERSVIPLSVAVEIANTDDEGEQEALVHIYETGQLRGKRLTKARQLIERRRVHGKRLRGHSRQATPNCAADAALIINAYQEEAAKQKHLVQKDRLCESRLTFIVTAVKQLFADDNFVTLLRAEGLDTLPMYLASHVHAGRAES